MTTLLATRPPSLFDGPGGEPTLDELISGAWEGLAARTAVACPVCGRQMRPEYAQGGQLVRGRCEGCGSTLA